MEFNKYQELALTTAIYPETLVDDGTEYGDLNVANYIYPTLGLVGEAGEVAEKIKKLIRDKRGIYNSDDIDAIKKELGDTLWYIAVLASEFDIDLDDVASNNIEKLASRKDRGVIKGSGDNR